MCIRDSINAEYMGNRKIGLTRGQIKHFEQMSGTSLNIQKVFTYYHMCSSYQNCKNFAVVRDDTKRENIFSVCCNNTGSIVTASEAKEGLPGEACDQYVTVYQFNFDDEGKPCQSSKGCTASRVFKACTENEECGRTQR
eukprot:TRINITY_DN2521_c0_g1_i1.p1 TRINITY_DN2521_c0_g1~~TRINITY_DN2521_c0_g1_i1.p1  ORF type:complete len:139 (+),score=10.78 TRINITY_DN2521_c0_g1_i1:162-578(+)